MSLPESYAATLHRERQALLDLLRGTRFTALKEGISHQQVIPKASYSPWQDDVAFQQAIAAIQGHTLVDIYRCHELWTLVRRTAAVAGEIVEIGVWRGGTAALMGLANRGSRPGECLHLFDTFAGVVKAVEGKDTNYRGGEHADTSEATVRSLLQAAGDLPAAIHVGMFPDDTLAGLPAQVRLCHVDVDTYGSAKACLQAVWPRLSRGGVMVFDDYGFWGCEGVTDLLNHESPADSLLIHNLNGHGLLIKV